jgi:hypothetical protein
MGPRRLLSLLLVLLLAGLGCASARAAALPVRWGAPYLADHTAPFATPTSLSGVGCAADPAAGGACLGVGPAGTIVRVDTTPAITRSGIDAGATLTSVACPSASLCVATEPTALLTSTDPFAGSPHWSHTAVPLAGAGAISGISCGGPSLCVAWTDSKTILVSADPAAGASSWHAQSLAGEVFSVACVPGATECVASLGETNGVSSAVAVSPDPGDGLASWATVSLPGRDPLTALACPSAGLCAGITDTDAIATSTDPARGASWTAAPVVSGIHTGLIGFACASASSCVGAVSDGSIVTSGDPAAGAASYTQSPVLDPAGFGTANVNEITCAAPQGISMCFVPDRGAGIATVTLGPPPTASVAPALGGTTRITGLACPARYQCLGTDAGGGIVSTFHPRRGIGYWDRELIPGAGAGLAGLSCPTTHFCAAVGPDDVVATSRAPQPGGLWRHTVLRFRYTPSSGGGPEPYDLTSISCPSYRFCVAGNGQAGVMISTHPALGQASWRFVRPGAASSDAWITVACPASDLCVAGQSGFGRIAVSSRPLGGPHAWHLFRIASGTGSLAPAITALSCPSRGFCLAADGRGSVHWSTRPLGGPRAWHGARIAGGRLIAARCRSTRFCVVIDGSDHVFTSTDPLGGARTWHATTLATGHFPLGTPAQESLTALACADRLDCIAGTGVGAIFPGTTS